MSRYKTSIPNYERERIILQCIRDNPHLHHNGLLKIIVPKFMAKTTFEKVRDSLVTKEIIFVEKKGNMKFYVATTNYREKSQQHLEQNTTKKFHDLKLNIKKLDVDFPHKDVDQKISVGTTLLKNLLQTDNGFTILDSIKNPKKTLYRDEHLIIQQLIFQLFKIIKNDADYEIIFPNIVSHHHNDLPKLTPDE